MSPYHVAGSVDLYRFHSELKDRIIAETGPDLATLHSLAVSAVAGTDHEHNRILRSLRFGEEWLSSEENEREPHLWYMTLLACSVQPVPDLSSNRAPMSWYVLDQTLPRLGWSDQDKDRLVYGNPLPAFLAQFDGGILTKVLVGAFGGFLQAKECGEIKADLISTQARPADPANTDLLESLGVKEPRALEFALLDALDMVQAALDRDEDLFVNVD